MLESSLRAAFSSSFILELSLGMMMTERSHCLLYWQHFKLMVLMMYEKQYKHTFNLHLAMCYIDHMHAGVTLRIIRECIRDEPILSSFFLHGNS